MTVYYKSISASGTILTLKDVKDFLKVEDSFDDEQIKALIDTAVYFAENVTLRDIYIRSWEAYYNGLHIDTNNGVYMLDIEKSPMRSITTTEVYVSGAYTASTATIKQRDMDFYTRLFLSSIDQTPDSDCVYPYKISFTTGYGANIPLPLKLAIKQHINFLWNNREDVMSDGNLAIPTQALAIYKSYRPLYHIGV